MLKQGAADLGRAARGDRRPLIGICRVRCLEEKDSEVSGARQLPGVVRVLRERLMCLSSSVTPFVFDLGRTALENTAPDEWF